MLFSYLFACVCVCVHLSDICNIAAIVIINYPALAAMACTPNYPTLIRHLGLAGFGGYMVQEVDVEQIQQKWEFRLTINAYAYALEYPVSETSVMVQTMVHFNVVEPTVSLICTYLGDAYEGKYNLISGPGSALIKSDRAKVLEEIMCKRYRDHVCDREAWSGPLCMNIELHRAVTYMWQGYLRCPKQKFKELHELVGVTPWHFADYIDLALYYHPPPIYRFFLPYSKYRASKWQSSINGWLSSKGWQTVKKKRGRTDDETVAQPCSSARRKLTHWNYIHALPLDVSLPLDTCLEL